MMMKAALVLVLCFAGVMSQHPDDCIGQPDCTIVGDGSCEGAWVCQDETLLLISCPREQGITFDTTTCQCAPLEEANGPCGIIKDCTGVPNSNYPLCETGCRWYFNCFEGTHTGNVYCGANPDQVFDFQGQFCNWDFNVCSPCGTRTDPDCEGAELLCDIGLIPETQD